MINFAVVQQTKNGSAVVQKVHVLLIFDRFMINVYDNYQYLLDIYLDGNKGENNAENFFYLTKCIKKIDLQEFTRHSSKLVLSPEEYLICSRGTEIKLEMKQIVQKDNYSRFSHTEAQSEGYSEFHWEILLLYSLTMQMDRYYGFPFDFGYMFPL